MTVDVTRLRGRRADTRATRLSVGDTFERMRWSRPDAVLITALDDACEHPDHRELTVAAADDLANRFAHAVLARGAEPGDVVALVCENSVEALVAKVGLAKAGVTAAPLNPKLAPDVVEELLRLTGARFALVDAESWAGLQKPLAAAGVETLAAIAVGGDAPAPSFRELVGDQPATEPDVGVHGDDIWQILFTSGTSATPKGVMIPHVKTVLEAMAMTGNLTQGLRHDHDVVLGGFLPIVYHVGDITIFSALLAGGRVVLGRRPVPGDLAAAVDRHRITALWAGSPQVVQGLDAALRAAPHLDAGSLTSVVHGFAPLHPAAYRSLRETLRRPIAVTEIIGQTEICCCHRFFLDEHEDLYERSAPQQNYVGLPHPLMASAIADADASGTGEGVFRSPALTPGYYREPDATERAMRDGWFHGGDAFRTGEAGQRIVVDRFKDIVKTGGENVSSIRVEQTLMAHDAVARAAVVGLPHDRWGEAVTAVVLLHEPGGATTDQLLAHCRPTLAGFEMPKEVVFVDAFPEAVGGKIRKNVLRERYADLYREGSLPPGAVPHPHDDRCWWDVASARWVCTPEGRR
ncbi:acyl-CoA synthetase (AMP-forming)/AMP-acid ligase II [Actinomycetospora succinea]|uniref:Acyl-CoA synthetase (AMP-forming)/AMP-acid ligase II n=1 Tax=Actinomycetospora succinea TaxID=663603 RepID=A0A4R6UXV9_9PSEU|nr:AMP-binding protein [Actinomycetospora succinea]TDQ50869.1 acyl-CoA synthetase (AMP-forming)/AMP-acid ligase II [Actinomycetospora succinea]